MSELDEDETLRDIQALQSAIADSGHEWSGGDEMLFHETRSQASTFQIPPLDTLSEPDSVSQAGQTNRQPQDLTMTSDEPHTSPHHQELMNMLHSIAQEHFSSNGRQLVHIARAPPAVAGLAPVVLEMNRHVQGVLAEQLEMLERAMRKNREMQRKCKKWLLEQSSLDRQMETRSVSSVTDSATGVAVPQLPEHFTTAEDALLSLKEYHPPDAAVATNARSLSQQWFSDHGVPDNEDTIRRRLLHARVPEFHRLKTWSMREKARLRAEVHEALQKAALESYRRSLMHRPLTAAAPHRHPHDPAHTPHHSQSLASEDANGGEGTSGGVEGTSGGGEGTSGGGERTVATAPAEGVLLEGSITSFLRAGTGDPLARMQSRPGEGMALSAARLAAGLDTSQSTPPLSSLLPPPPRVQEQMIVQKMDKLKNAKTVELVCFEDQINWNKVKVPKRSAMECKLMWDSTESPRLTQEPWTREEDKLLLQVVVECKAHDWQRISDRFNECKNIGKLRSPLQCFLRYQKSLNTELIRKGWTKEEDAMLQKAVERFGRKNWQQVATAMDRRTGQQCMHRWLKSIDPSIKRARWTPAEDEMLRKAVCRYGLGSWSYVSEHIPERTDVQCRERYMNVINPQLDASEWTPEEDTKLRAAVAAVGMGKWTEVAKMVQPRTDNQCWRRWKSLNKGEVQEYLHERRRKQSSLVTNFGSRREPPKLTFNDVEDIIDPPAPAPSPISLPTDTLLPAPIASPIAMPPTPIASSTAPELYSTALLSHWRSSSQSPRTEQSAPSPGPSGTGSEIEMSEDIRHSLGSLQRFLQNYQSLENGAEAIFLGSKTNLPPPLALTSSADSGANHSPQPGERSLNSSVGAVTPSRASVLDIVQTQQPDTQPEEVQSNARKRVRGVGEDGPTAPNQPGSSQKRPRVQAQVDESRTHSGDRETGSENHRVTRQRRKPS